MESKGISSQPLEKPARLHYIDWLRILAILGVFLFHAVHPFDDFEWEIKNVETSLLVTLFIVFFVPWGMSFFFLISGMGSWFALRRRTSSQYALERFSRLFPQFSFIFNGKINSCWANLMEHWLNFSPRGKLALVHAFLALQDTIFGFLVFYSHFPFWRCPYFAGLKMKEEIG
jgi:hypothetical protein